MASAGNSIPAGLAGILPLPSGKSNTSAPAAAPTKVTASTPAKPSAAPQKPATAAATQAPPRGTARVTESGASNNKENNNNKNTSQSSSSSSSSAAATVASSSPSNAPSSSQNNLEGGESAPADNTNRNIIIGVVVGAVVIFTILFFILRSARKKIAKNKMIQHNFAEAQKAAEREAMKEASMSSLGFNSTSKSQVSPMPFYPTPSSSRAIGRQDSSSRNFKSGGAGTNFPPPPSPFVAPQSAGGSRIQFDPHGGRPLASPSLRPSTPKLSKFQQQPMSAYDQGFPGQGDQGYGQRYMSVASSGSGNSGYGGQPMMMLQSEMGPVPQIPSNVIQASSPMLRNYIDQQQSLGGYQGQQEAAYQQLPYGGGGGYEGGFDNGGNQFDDMQETQYGIYIRADIR